MNKNICLITLVVMALMTMGASRPVDEPTLPPIQYIITPPKVVTFDAVVTTGAAPFTAFFNDTTVGSTNTSWAWTFGDGGTSTLQNPSHTYSAPGVYMVYLNACDALACDDITRVGYIVVSGYPYVSSVTDVNGGSIANGDVLTIAGVSFGAVASPAMTIYDNLETGSQSASWDSDASNPPYSDVPVIATTAPLRRHAGSSYHGRQQFTGDRSIMDSYGTYRDGVASRTFFGGYWFRLADDWQWGSGGAYDGSVGASLSNVKFIRLSTASSVDDWTIAAHPYSGSGIWATAVSASCNGSGVTSEAGYCCGEWTNWDDAQWHHVQFEWVDSSAAGVADARFKVWVDGQVVDEASGFTGVRCPTGGYKRIFGLGFYDSWHDSSADPNKSVPYNFYIDDIYYDTQLARVELGNASTYAACTHREIQLSTSWANGSISTVANLGSFASASGKYLYVIDSTGRASIGYLIP